MIKTTAILKRLHILAIMLLCGLMLVDAAAGSVCLCESSEKKPIGAELRAVDDAAAADADHDDHSEKEHSDCQDQSCFCCVPKLTRRLSFTFAVNEREIASSEAYSPFVQENSFPPLTPPPKTT